MQQLDNVINVGLQTSVQRTYAIGLPAVYSVRATNASGSSDWSSQVGTVAGICMSANPAGCGTGQINVSWDPPPSGAVTHEIRINGGSWIPLGNANTYQHTGLAAGTNHTYQLRRWNILAAGVVVGQASASAPAACAPSCA